VYAGQDVPGITDAAAGVTPSDSTGAKAPTTYAEFINSEIAVWSDGIVTGSPSILDESAFVGDPSAITCDPQIQWDEQSQRWLYAALDCGEASGGDSETLFFGWSTTDNPVLTPSAWCRYALNTQNSIEDYPKLGHDNSQIIIGTNAFDDVSGNYSASHIFVFDKPSLGDTSCPSSAAEQSTMLEADAGGSDFTPVPANLTDSSATGYVVAANFNDMSHLDLYAVGRNGSNQNVILGTTSVTVPSFAVPASVPQADSGDPLDSLDARLTQAVAATDPATGSEGIWTQHTVAGPGGGPSVVRWYELAPGATTPTQTGTVSGPAGSFAFNGAISPAAGGSNAAIFYNSSSSSQLVDWRVQDRRSDTPQGTTTEDMQLATSSSVDRDLSCPSNTGTSDPCRWGDYAGASPDPSNACLVWGTGTLTVATPTDSGTPQWGTQNAGMDTCTKSFTLRVDTAGAGTGTVNSSPAGIGCGAWCTDSFASGTSVTLTATPDPDSTFTGWSGDCSGTGACTVTMSQARTVTANFTIRTETLAVSESGTGTGTVTSSPAGINCGATCSSSYSYGTFVTLTAIPSPGTGSAFSGWSGACSGTGACSVPMYGTTFVTANFNRPVEFLVMNADGQGTVTASPPGKTCGNCLLKVLYGTNVTLTATPAPGWLFARWLGDCSGIGTGGGTATGTCTLPVLGNRNVTAAFAPSVALTVQISGAGTGKVISTPTGLSCPGTCSHPFAMGVPVQLKPTPAAGSEFAGWSDECSSVDDGNVCTLTLSSSATFTATFVKQCIVPKLNGKTLKAAKRHLKQAHCSTGNVTRKYAKAKKGRIAGQRPRPGAHRTNDFAVNLVVSRGRRG
jgi:hypothetical protein